MKLVDHLKSDDVVLPELKVEVLEEVESQVWPLHWRMPCWMHRQVVDWKHTWSCLCRIGAIHRRSIQFCQFSCPVEQVGCRSLQKVGCCSLPEAVVRWTG